MRADEEGEKVALVTGANGAIGKAICKELARQGDHEIVMACRNKKRAARARQEVIAETGHDVVRYAIVDLSRRESVYELARQWRGALDVLVNNAAVTPRRRRETPEGLELQFATNVMGQFWMTRAFRKALARGRSPRVVNLSSYWAGGLDLEDLQFERRYYDNNAAYRQSKQANRMLSAVFARQFSDDGIRVYSCHPGDVPSRLARNLGFHGSDTPRQAAQTPVWLATSELGAEGNGGYFRDKSRRACRFSGDRKATMALYKRCLEEGCQV